ncbi:MAG: hypothetical protein QOI61_597, partial [Actinomycetota bacterium]
MTDLQRIAETVPHLVWIASPDGTTTYFNRAVCDYTGHSPEANSGWDWADLVHGDDLSRAQHGWRLATRQETRFELECRIRRFDGVYRWHAFRALPIRGAHGKATAWLGTATDIDDQRQIEASLRSSQKEATEALAVLQQVQSAAPWGFAFVDRDYRVLCIDDALAGVAGGTASERLGLTVAELVAPGVWAQIEHAYRQAMSGEPVINLAVSGSTPLEPHKTFYWMTSYHPVTLAGEIIGVSNLVVDVTDLAEQQEFRAAVMDNMGEGLYTLDGNGQLNYMNAAASKMLGWTEAELRGKPMHEAVHFQRADGTSCPGEDCRLRNVRTGAADMRVADETFTRKDGTTFPVAYSATPLRIGSAVRGVAVVFRDVSEELGDNGETLRELARLSWVGRIRDALDEDRLVLYAEPVVPLGDGRPSAELSLRMIGPSGNVILPGSFIPIAARYGLIAEIDRWVITQAVRLAATGRSVEVNLATVSINSVDMLTFIEDQIHAAGADPQNLTFEITETTIMQDLNAGASFARGLRALGCKFTLDDFGTGYGSFTYLKKLPVDYLRIDVDFVRDLATNVANRHLVRAIVSLAEAFGLQTIADGVEDSDTLQILREARVDFAQGLYFGPPTPTAPHAGPALMDFPGLSIDTSTREVRVDGGLVELTGREFGLLAYLAATPRHVFSRDELLRHVWLSQADWQSVKTVNEHVRRIRYKIEPDPTK